MKKIIVVPFILLGIFAFSQDTTIVENLQLRSRTIKVLAKQAMISGDTAITRVFFKWRGQFIPSPPSDNANVTIDVCPTVIVAWMYDRLLNLPGGLTKVEDYIGDFTTSILSKRNTNSFLDRLCDDMEARMVTLLISDKAGGLNFLTQQ